MTTEMTARVVGFEAEVRIAASPAVVWEAMTTGVGSWWPHTFADAPVRIALEPEIGGRFYERFDESGAGALYAHVTYVEPEKTLRISGPMGMRGAVLYVKTYRLEPFDGGTVVRTSAQAMGAMDDETVEGYRVGGIELLDALKANVEGAVVAGQSRG